MNLSSADMTGREGQRERQREREIGRGREGETEEAEGETARQTDRQTNQWFGRTMWR